MASVPSSPNGATAVDADRAGLTYVSDDEPGIRRVVRGKGLAYRRRARPAPSAIPKTLTRDQAPRDAAGLDRRVDLARPGRPYPGDRPRCARAQAVPLPRGLHEGAGRRPSTSTSSTFAPCAAGDPAAGRARHGAGAACPSRRCVATVVHLLDSTLIRVGNADYARAERQLRADHAPRPPRRGRRRRAPLRVQGQERQDLAAEAAATGGRRGSSSRARTSPASTSSSSSTRTGRAARSARPTSTAGSATSSGRDITAKDFRTWAGTVLAAMALREFEAFDTRGDGQGQLREAIERVARRLGNTPTICRKCYVHPEILDQLSRRRAGARGRAAGRRPQLRGDLANAQARRGRGDRLPQGAAAGRGHGRLRRATATRETAAAGHVGDDRA